MRRLGAALRSILGLRGWPSSPRWRSADRPGFAQGPAGPPKSEGAPPVTARKSPSRHQRRRSQWGASRPLLQPDGKELVLRRRGPHVRVWGVQDGEARHAAHLARRNERALRRPRTGRRPSRRRQDGRRRHVRHRHRTARVYSSHGQAGSAVERVSRSRSPPWGPSPSLRTANCGHGGEERHSQTMVLLWDMEPDRSSPKLPWPHRCETARPGLSPRTADCASEVLGSNKTVAPCGRFSTGSQGQPPRGHTDPASLRPGLEPRTARRWTASVRRPGHHCGDHDGTKRHSFQGKYAGVGVAFSGDSKRPARRPPPPPPIPGTTLDHETKGPSVAFPRRRPTRRRRTMGARRNMATAP